MEELSAVNRWSFAEPSAIRDYSQLRSRLLVCLDRLLGLDSAVAYALEELRSKIESNRFHLVVVGQFKRGKTCLINALIGADILPVAVIPLTSIVTVLTYGDTVSIQVYYEDGRVEAIKSEALADYVTETGNPRNERQVKEVLIHYPSPYLRDGVRLIDTPGVGSVFRHNTDVAYQYLPKCDAALFLLSVEQPASQAELDFLKDVGEYSSKIFFLLNKIDYLSEQEIEESVAFSRRVLSEAMGVDVRVFPVSAKLALQGALEGAEEDRLTSRLPAFSRVLDHFLVHEKGRILLLAASSHLLRVVSQARLAVELELKSLGAPLEELRGKIELVQAKGVEIAREKERIGVLLNSELERVLRETLDPEIKRFTRELLGRMSEELKRLFDDHRELPPKELDALLEAYVAREVENTYRAWRTTLEKKVASIFDERCEALAEKTNEIIEALMRFSSELFQVPFESFCSRTFWAEDSRFHFKLREDLVGLDMVASSIAGTLPGLVARRFERLRAFVFRRARTYVFNKRRRHMEEVIEMHAGRIRYDFIERLTKSTAVFLSTMRETVGTAMDSIAQAVHRGMERRREGEREAERRREELSESLMEIDSVREELLSIREGALIH
ncbi:MAG: dynamin family protein [Syntrophobacteraceae bacterium]